MEEEAGVEVARGWELLEKLEEGGEKTRDTKLVEKVDVNAEQVGESLEEVGGLHKKMRRAGLGLWAELLRGRVMMEVGRRGAGETGVERKIY